MATTPTAPPLSDEALAAIEARKGAVPYTYGGSIHTEEWDAAPEMVRAETVLVVERRKVPRGYAPAWERYRRRCDEDLATLLTEARRLREVERAATELLYAECGAEESAVPAILTRLNRALGDPLDIEDTDA